MIDSNSFLRTKVFQISFHNGYFSTLLQDLSMLLEGRGSTKPLIDFLKSLELFPLQRKSFNQSRAFVFEFFMGTGKLVKLLHTVVLQHYVFRNLRLCQKIFKTQCERKKNTYRIEMQYHEELRQLNEVRHFLRNSKSSIPLFGIEIDNTVKTQGSDRFQRPTQKAQSTLRQDLRNN